MKILAIFLTLFYLNQSFANGGNINVVLKSDLTEVRVLKPASEEAKEETLTESEIDNYCESRPRFRKSCIDFVCEQLGSFGCDQDSEIFQVAAACNGVRGTRCLEESVSRMFSSFYVDQLSEIKPIIESCKNQDGQCTKYICDRLSSFACDSVEEIVQINKRCAHPNRDQR